jgi:hypothetical protein
MTFDTAQIRADNPLSFTISKSLLLKHDGSEFRACCPFHKEKTPSFTVSDEKGFYHCFGCGAHGDIIRFVQDFYSVEFPEACEILGGKRDAPTRAVPEQDVKEKDDHDAYAGLIPIYPLPEIKAGVSVRYWNPKRQHFVSSVPTMVFPYRNFAGEVIGYVLRIEIEGNKLTPTSRARSTVWTNWRPHRARFFWWRARSARMPRSACWTSPRFHGAVARTGWRMWTGLHLPAGA